MRMPPVKPDSVFLNIPYDDDFRSLYLAYIAGLTELGLTPRATLEITGHTARLDKIFRLIQTCRYSLHDLSRVELNQKRPPTPRFNMPFELGLAVGWAKLNRQKHTCFICETKDLRVQKSLSDLNGIDCNIHQGQPKGVMRELRNAFVRPKNKPTVAQMMRTYHSLEESVAELKRKNGAKTIFEAQMFRYLVLLAAQFRDERKRSPSAH